MFFENINKQFGIPHAHLFKYFKIQHFIRSKVQSYQCPPLITNEELVTSDNYAKGNILIISKILVGTSTESSNPNRIAWIEELQTNKQVPLHLEM